MEQPQPVAERGGALDVQLAHALAEALVERGEVELDRLSLERTVRGEPPDEAALTSFVRTGAEPEQGAEGPPGERREQRERLQIGLLFLALVVIRAQLAAQDRTQRAGRLVREAKDAEPELVVADHVDVVAAAGDAARSGDVRRTAGTRRRLELELAQHAQSQRRELLGFG